MTDHPWTGEAIRAWRDRMGFKTQADAATALGVAFETYRSYEPGRSGRARRAVPAYISRLCEALENQRNAEILFTAAPPREAARVLAGAYLEAYKAGHPDVGISDAEDDVAPHMEAALESLSDQGLVVCRKKSA